MLKWILIFSAVLVGWFALQGSGGRMPDDERRQVLANSRDVQELAQAVINQSKANVETVARGNLVTVSFDIRPWSLTKGTAQRQFKRIASEVVRTLFEKLPDVSTIRVRALTEFTDMRGNKSLNQAMWVEFSRSNAASIQWRNIDIANVPRIADASWVHPSLLTD